MDGLEENTAPYTPEGKRRTALVERLLKHMVHRWNKAMCISESTRQAHLGLFWFFNVNRSQ